MNEEQYHLPLDSVLDNFKIEAVLGEGGFGITYRAYDNILAQTVAIKEYLPTDFALRVPGQLSVTLRRSRQDAKQNFHYGLDRFRDEARALAKFKNSYIVRVSKYFEANNTGYLVMEYEEGETLASYLNRVGTIPEAELLSYLLPIFEALRDVHSTGLLHRDIKPGNIYLRRGQNAAGKPKGPMLIDFGAARMALGEQSKSITNVVSEGYAPTEQYSNHSKQQGPWSDLYALGATIYHCISGQAPIDAPHRLESLFNNEPDPLVSAVKLGEDRYSVELLTAIDHMLEIRPRERPQSVTEALILLGATKPQIQQKTKLVEEQEKGFINIATKSCEETQNTSADTDLSMEKKIASSKSYWRIASGILLTGLLIWLATTWPSFEKNNSLETEHEATKIDETDLVATDPTTLFIPNDTITQLRTDSSVKSVPENKQKEVLYELIVNTVPSNALVRIMNIEPKYYDGIALAPSKYDVEVSREGYQTQRQWVELKDKDVVISITLKRKLVNRDLAQTMTDVSNPVTTPKFKGTALVIGNSNYMTGSLKTPKNDASDIAKSLLHKGFEVILRTNTSRHELEISIDEFYKKLKRRGGVGLFYYAGHGIQINGENYMIPVEDGTIKNETDVQYSSTPLEKVLGYMDEANSELNIVILDACRNNPIERSFRSAKRGLAKIRMPKSDLGYLVAYSTEPGDVALDDSGRNSPFTRHLLNAMNKDEKSLSAIFRKVKRNVYKETNKKQHPFLLDGTLEDFNF